MKESWNRLSRSPRPRTEAGCCTQRSSNQAAAYLFHLCANHPFVDGNKRVAFAAMETFLRLNGFRLTLSDDEAYALSMRAARGEMRKEAIAVLLKRSTKALERS